MEVKDNEGIRPEVRRENDAAADQEREIDVMDCKASEATDPKVAKAGDRIQFLHDASEEDEGLFYWLEGRIQQRVTK